MLTYEEAAAAVTGPGERFEIETIEVDGVPVKAFKHAPPSLRELFATARERGDATFLVYEDERWSFAEVMGHVDALAALLVDRYGVTPGDRVAIGMRNYPEWVVTFWATQVIGAVAVPLNAWWTGEELQYAVEHSGAVVAVLDDERYERLAPHLGAPVRGVVVARARRGVPAAPVLTMSMPPSVRWTSQVHPEPKLPTADFTKASLNAA